jgi:porin
VIVDTTSEEFLDDDGEKERLTAVVFSFDQELGDIFGAFIRFAWEDDAARINYDMLYKGGINILGSWHGREQDNIGIGYAYLNSADDSDIDKTHVFEVYGRFMLNEVFAATADFQYMSDV